MNRLRDSDLHLFKTQESTIQRLHSEQVGYVAAVGAQQREIEEMRGMLQRTVEVKMEYEGVIKEMLEDERVRDMVIEICLRKRQEKELRLIEEEIGGDYPLDEIEG